MRTKVKSRYIIGYDGCDHVIYKDAELVFEDDKIIFVGKSFDGEVQKTIDAGNSVLSPGFIDLDALGDIDHELFFNAVEDSNNIQWSKEYFEKGPVEPLSLEDESFKSLYAYSHLIKSGITTAMPISCVFHKRAGETYEEMAAAVKNAAKLGLRSYIGPSYISGMKTVGKNAEIDFSLMGTEGMDGVERAAKFFDEFDGYANGLINSVFVPERIEIQTEEVLLKTKEEARKRNAHVRLHAAQGLFEYDYIMKKYGLSSIQYLDKIGFLDEKTLIPHAIVASGYSKIDDQTDKDLEILAKRKTSIIHCPLVYSTSGTALESFGRYKDLGVNISMGTDTFPPDFFMNVRVGSTLAKNKDGNRAVNDYASFYRSLTLEGAKALSRDDLGRLAEGAKADMIAISLDRYGMGVSDDPIHTIFKSGFSDDVKMSIIDGKVVMQDRKIDGIDEKKMEARAQEYYEKMKNSYLDRSYKKFEKAEDLFKPTFRHMD